MSELKSFRTHTDFVIETLINLFFLLRKGVCSYEYMDSWKKVNETLLVDKKLFTAN